MTPTEYAYKAAARYDAVNTEYIKLMAEHIKEIGKLTPTDVHRLEQFIKMNKNIDKINTMLVKTTALTLKELKGVYENSGINTYSSLYNRLSKGTVENIDTDISLRYALAIYNVTAKNLYALTNTTAISDTYKLAIDTAIKTVYEGTEDFNSAMRKVLKQATTMGTRVTYASGLTRRLDSAVRMNILDGINQVNQEMSNLIAKQIHTDAVLVSAHTNCALDHLDIQGNIYSIEDFNKINDNLEREIGQWNCRHITYPATLGEKNPYSKDYLKKLRTDSLKKYIINDKEVSRYDATQVMRKLETNIRYQKDIAIAGKYSGDTKLVKNAKNKISSYKKAYMNICNITGLTPQLDRAVVSGYK